MIATREASGPDRISAGSAVRSIALARSSVSLLTEQARSEAGIEIQAIVRHGDGEATFSREL